MGGVQDQARLLWCLSGSGQPATITANGSSGGWAAGTPPSEYPRSPIGLTRVTDAGLFVNVGGTPSGTLVVQLDVYDDQGNLYPAVLKTAGITAAGPATPVFAGLHGGAAGAYVVFPDWAQVSWTVTTGASFPATEIALYGR